MENEEIIENEIEETYEEVQATQEEIDEFIKATEQDVDINEIENEMELI